MTVIDVLVKATALVVIAAVVDALVGRRGSAAVRHLVWAAAMAGLLALPIAMVALPRWTVTIPIAAPAAPQTSVPDANPRPHAEPPSPTLTPGTSVPAWAPPSPAGRDGGGLTGTEVATAVYVAGVLFLVVRLVLEPFAIGRLARASRAVTDAAWLQSLAAAARQLRIRKRIRLLRSTDETIPITFGTLRPAVVIPASSDAWDAERRRAVLLHELAHIARRDCLTQLTSAVVCAMYWPHPGVWLAARRLRVERELACDDRVIASGTDPQDYAGHLLELARWLRPAPALATALAMARARDLEHRLLAILDAARNRDALRRSRAAIAVGVSLTILLPVAALHAAIGPASRVTATLVQAGQDLSGTWELRLSGGGTTAHLTVRTAHGSHGETMPTARLEALTGMRLAGLNGPVRLPIRREAGTFVVDGNCRADVCAGTVVFEPDPAFPAALAKRGIGAPSRVEQFQLALRDIGVAFLDEIARDGYAKPDIQMLVRAAEHGVDTEYVRQMTEFGYRLRTLDTLIKLRDHGIDPAYVRGMAANGFARLSADDLLRARDHGVDPEYVRGMRDHGFVSLDLAGLIDARDHGIDPEFAEGLAALGYRDLPLQTLLDARNHGVDPEYIRGMRDLGYRGSLGELRQMREHGIDPEYVRGLASLGYRTLALDLLVRLREHGVDPEFIRGLAAQGYRDLPVETLVRMRDHGVDPAYVRSVREKGLGQLTPDQLIDRRDRGLDEPGAAAREMYGALQSLWRSLVGR